MENSLPEKSSCAILLSRQPLRPCRSTPWIMAVSEAIDWVKKRGYCLYTSVGMQTWEFLVFLARKKNIGQHIVLPCSSGKGFERMRQNVLEQFALQAYRTNFIPASDRFTECATKKLLLERDRRIISSASLLIPVSVRSKGRMSKMIQEKMEKKPRAVMNRFRIPYQKRTRPISYRIDPELVSRDSDLIGAKHLVHWTRGSNGPWPTEKRIDYYSDIFRSNSYPRSAFNTLKNILITHRIKSTSAHMPEAAATVCFSGLSPMDALSLMRWRARYVRMSLEPYGVGIKRELGRKLGILPVCYYNGKDVPVGIEPWRLQSRGIKGNWPAEDEYRCLGDFSFSEVPIHELVCFCKTAKEAAEIERQFGIETHPLTRSECS